MPDISTDSRPTGFRATIIATTVMALISTFADAVWANAVSEHRVVFGVVHGALLLGVQGLILAVLLGGRSWVAGAAAGVAVGAGAAAVFYILAPFVGSAAMLIAWMALWLAFAFLSDLLEVPSVGSPARTAGRGLLAALLSGLGFWTISGIWAPGHDPGPLYVVNLGAWAIAFLPGFAALLLGRDGRR